MNEAKKDKALKNEFYHLSKELQDMDGYGYVRELWEHQEYSISPTELYCATNNAELPENNPDPKVLFLPEIGYSISSYPYTLIPLTDRKTIRQIKARAAALLCNLNTAKLDNDATLQSYYHTELAKLWHYLSHSVTKNGRIILDGNLNRKHQLLIYRAVQKFYAKLQESHPELAEYICQHIVIRMRCYWSEVPIIRKG